MKNVFIIGSKGIPANYGGYETFVNELAKNKKSSDIKYHVACQNAKEEVFECNGATCFNVNVPNVGPAKAILYDYKAFKYCLRKIKSEKLNNSIIYVLTCRIGPLFKRLIKKAHKLEAKVYLNPDGHEWLRSKWSAPVKKYWKISEKLMVKHSDLIICDSKSIKKYIDETYKKYNPNTTYIAYGAYGEKSTLKDDDKALQDLYSKHKFSENGYYLVVGRFVPENNYEIILREFMKSETKKDLILITNYQENKFSKDLENKLNFSSDSRIKFIGTVYNAELLKKIRENAFAYIHGHSVGGTNPSLLEALASTKLNILYDVCFNKECGGHAALYFNKEADSLKYVIKLAESLDEEDIKRYEEYAKKEVQERYSWNFICSEYETLFLKEE